MSPDKDKERTAAQKTGPSARDDDQALERIPGRGGSDDRAGPKNLKGAPNEDVAPPTPARGDNLDLGTDADIAASEGPRGEAEPWHRLSPRHDTDVQTAEHTGRVRDKEVQEGAVDAVTGFTNTDSGLGDVGGRSAYGMRDETEEEEEPDKG